MIGFIELIIFLVSIGLSGIIISCFLGLKHNGFYSTDFIPIGICLIVMVVGASYLDDDIEAQIKAEQEYLINLSCDELKQNIRQQTINHNSTYLQLQKDLLNYCEDKK